MKKYCYLGNPLSGHRSPLLYWARCTLVPSTVPHLGSPILEVEAAATPGFAISKVS